MQMFQLKTTFLALMLGWGVMGQGAWAASMNFNDTEITKVIEGVAKLSGKNFIIDPRVKGRVTVITQDNLSPKDIYDTLLAILAVHGFAAVEGPTAIKIVPNNLVRDMLTDNPKALAEDWVTEVVALDFVQATRLVAILRPLVAKEGHLVALAESNRLIITDIKQNLERIKKILKRVDVATEDRFEIIDLKYATAKDMVKLINQILDKEEKPLVQLVADERANRMIVSAAESLRLKVRTLVAQLDSPVKTSGQVEVIYLKYAKAKDLLPLLKNLAKSEGLLAAAQEAPGAKGTTTASAAPQEPRDANSSPSSAPTKVTTPVSIATTNPTSSAANNAGPAISIEADERMNALILSAPPGILSEIRGVIDKLDIRRAQVQIEAIIAEVSEDQANQMGVQWGFAGNSGVGVINFDGALPGLLTSGPASALGLGANVAAGEINGDSGWALLVRALSSNTQSNILSIPSVVTLDNEEATMVVGKEVPFTTGSYTSTGTSSSPSNPFTTIQRKNVGISLKVTPHINEGSAVALDLDQEISDVLPSSQGAVDLVTSKRQIATKVIVEDGNAIVLGGLMDNKESTGTAKVPWLGDIPYVGALFRNRSSTAQKTKLMLFIRPKIIRDEAVSAQLTSEKYQALRDAQVAQYRQDDPQLTADILSGRVMPSLQTWQTQGSTPLPVPEPEPAKNPDEALSW